MQYDINTNAYQLKPNVKNNFRFGIPTRQCHQCQGLMFPFDTILLKIKFSGHVCIDCGRIIYDKERVVKHVS